MSKKSKTALKLIMFKLMMMNKFVKLNRISCETVEHLYYLNFI